MLEAVALSCRRGERRLFQDLHLDVQPGSLLHVRGRNGSGKTTLLRTLCGLFTPETGEVRWRGKSIQSLGEDYRRELLYCGHLLGLKADLTAIENLAIASTLSSDPVRTHELWQALERLGLAGFEDLPIRMLSQGQKKRVALARLLLSHAPLWVLDEPFSALDREAVCLLEELLARHLGQGGLVILTTHQEVPLTSGRVAHLDLGY